MVLGDPSTRAACGSRPRWLRSSPPERGCCAPGLDAAGFAESGDLVVGEDAGADEEADALAVLEGEHAAHAGDHVEHDLGVLPVLELAAADVEGRAVEGCDEDVAV